MTDPAAPQNAKPSICFVALNAYGLLSGRNDLQHIGGAEVQQVLLAREFVRRDYRVSFVVLDHGQPDGQQIDGIRVYKAYPRDAGVRFVRFLHPRVTRLWSAMRRADATIYYQRGAATETGLVVRWCQWNGRRVVFALAHDSNCDPKLPLLAGVTERRLYRYGLRRADVILSQSNQQKRLLLDGFGLSSVLVRSCCHPELSAEDPLRGSPQSAFSVLWVGRLSPEKRSEWIPELAGTVPNCHFDIVGQCNLRSTYGREFRTQLHSVPNVTYHPYVARADMVTLYRRANLLLCTSVAEGFPNVFLEAWTCGTPVLSSVDPDALIEKYGLGEVAADFEALQQRLLDAPARLDHWRQCGRAAQKYVSAHHSVAATVDALECAIEAALRDRRRHRPALFKAGTA